MSNEDAVQPTGKLGLGRNLGLMRDHLGPAGSQVAVSCLLAIVSATLDLLPILAMYLLVEKVVTGTAVATDFYGLAAMLLVSIPASYAAFGFATRLSHMAAFEMIHSIRRQMAERMLRLPLGYFSKIRSGEARKLMLDEPEQLELLVAHAIPEGIGAVTTWLAVSIWLLWLDWRIAIVVTFTTMIAFVCLFIALRRSLRDMGQYQQASADLSGSVSEVIRNIATTKAFGDNCGAYRSVRSAIDGYADVQTKMGRGFAPFGAAFGVLSLANITVIVPTALWLLFHGYIELPGLLLAVFLGGNYTAPIAKLFDIFKSFSHISTSLTQITRLFNTPLQSDSKVRVELDNFDLTFHGAGLSLDNRSVLNEIDCICKTGETTAVVGPSGAGKTTFAQSVPRFHDLTRGSVSIGTHDITRICNEQLMETISFVFQETFIFSGSIEENLRLAKSNATHQDLETAAKAAQIHEFIRQLPRGYQTLIGEGGQHLSGGQKQRIAIARALLKNSPIVILDEATAFLDPDCEEDLQIAIGNLVEGKTLIVIAHRLGSVTPADQILVLEQGTLIEQGTHSELLSRNGLYARMWQAYRSGPETQKPAASPATCEPLKEPV
ncbi:MAG: ABC transporter ATP-binding protein [Pseudomonadota bacterium]